MANDRPLSRLESDRAKEQWKEVLLDTAIICADGYKMLPAEMAEWIKRYPHVFHYRAGDESYVNLLHYSNRSLVDALKKVKK